MTPEEISRLCQADGYWELWRDGTEHYWSCGDEAVASLVQNRQQVCEAHLEEALEEEEGQE
jgi:hypothetical protein